MQQWYYAQNGEQKGPVDDIQLKALFAQGAIDAQSLVWRDGMSDWLPLATQMASLGLRSAPAPAQPSAPRAPVAAMPTPPAPPAASSSPYAPPRAALASEDAPVYSDAPVVQAGFLRRFAALIVDGFLLSLGLIGSMLLLAIPFGLFAGGSDSEAMLIMFQLGYYVLYIIVAAVYYAGQESSAAQATLGKRLVGIKVVDLQGRRLSFMHALGRWVAAAASYMTLYIGFLLAAFTQKKQALHDMIASTYVVDRWAYTEYPERQRTNAGCLVIGLVLLLLLVPIIGILAAIAIPAYSDYTSRARISGAIMEASPFKVAVSEYYYTHERCPSTTDELGLSPPASALVREITVGELASDQCEIVITLDSSVTSSGWSESQVTLSMDEDQRWTCRSDLPGKHLPASCRQ